MAWRLLQQEKKKERKRNQEGVKVVAKVKTLITDSFRQKKVWGQKDFLRKLSCRSKFTEEPHLRQFNGQARERR